MIHQLGWQKLETCRYISHLSFLFKILYNLTCVPLSDITLSNTSAAAESVARSFDVNNISVPFARTDMYQHSFGPDVCKKWNNLPKL